MHFEVPKSKFATIREFFGEYAMIVVSILTALALEFAAERMHHAHRAEMARANMDTEIRENLQAIRAARKDNEAEAKLLTKLYETLAADMRAKLPDEEIIAHFKQIANNHFNLMLIVPEPRHDAWDAAVASQSASWIAPDVFLKYSKAYTTQRALPNLVSANMATVLNGPRMVDVLTDVEAGTVAPRELFHTVAQMQAVHGIADMVMANSDRKVSKVFPQFAVATGPAVASTN